MPAPRDKGVVEDACCPEHTSLLYCLRCAAVGHVMCLPAPRVGVIHVYLAVLMVVPRCTQAVHHDALLFTDSLLDVRLRGLVEEARRRVRGTARGPGLSTSRKRACSKPV
jgi:hypothetical protein